MKISELIRKYSFYIWWLLLAVTIKTLLLFIGPLVVRRLLQLAELPAAQTANIILYAGIFAVAFILLYAVNFGANWLYLKFSLRFKVSLSRDLYDKVFRMEYSHFQGREAAYFVNRIKQFADNAFTLLGDNIPAGVVAGITIIVSLFFISTFSKGLLVMAAILLPLNYFGYRKVNRRLLQKSSALQHDCAENFRNMVNVTGNTPAIKQLAEYPFFVDFVGRYAERIERDNNGVLFYAKNVGMVMSFLVDLLKNAILLYSIYLLYRNSMSFADVMFLSMIMTIYFSALSDLNRINLGLRDVTAGLNFVNSELMANLENSGPAQLPKVETISFSTPSFTYDGSKDVLRNFELDISSGEKISVVGKSGCGKSTLARLLTRIHTGEGVTVNGRPLKDYSLDSLRKRIYLVSQTSHLFPGTVEENILAGYEGEGDARHKDLLSLPFLKDLHALSGGLSFAIKEGGSNLSGGQRQRIMLARMLLRDPDMIIFDEATSALDSSSEESLMDNIEELCRGKIMLYVSHRLSTVKRADKIVIMNDGAVEASGSFKELASSNSIFRDLFSAQMQG